MFKVIFKIWSKNIDRRTKEIVAYRIEYIDTKKNELFKDSKTKEDVKNRYESFWNIDKYENIVKVDRVQKVTIKSEGANWGIKMLK